MIKYLFSYIFILLITIQSPLVYASANHANEYSKINNEKEIISKSFLAPKTAFKENRFLHKLKVFGIMAMIFLSAFTMNSQTKHSFEQKRIKGGETEIVMIQSSFNVNGDTKIAIKDIRNILPESYKNEIGQAYNNKDGKRYIYFLNKNKSVEDWQKSKDPRVRLIYLLVTSSNRHEYNVSDRVTSFLFSNVTGEKIKDKYKSDKVSDLLSHPVTTNNNQVINAARTKTNPGDESSSYHAPLDENIDGQLTIVADLDSLYSDINRTTLMNKTSLVFHELWENYFRTDSSMTYDEAHAEAIKMEKLVSNKVSWKSKRPGVAYTRNRPWLKKKREEEERKQQKTEKTQSAPKKDTQTKSSS